MAAITRIAGARTVGAVFEGEEFTVQGSGLDAAGLTLRHDARPLVILRRTATEIVARAPWEPLVAPLILDSPAGRVTGPLLAVAIRPPAVAPPRPEPDPEPEPEPPGEWSAAQQRMVDLLNADRQENGLGALKGNAALMGAAQAYAEEVLRTGHFSHTGQNGSTPASRATAAGYRWSAIGENLAFGQDSAAATQQAWMNSSGHRGNCLNPSFTEVGTGEAAAARIQLFGRPR